MNTSMILAIGLLVIAFYLIISNRLIALIHPLKMDLVARGERLLDDSGLPPDAAVIVERSLDSAYSTSLAWLYVVMTPVAMVVAIYHQVMGRSDDSLADVPQRLRSDARIFGGMSVLLTIANSPLALVLFAMQMFVYAVLFFPVGTALRELMHIGTAAEEFRFGGSFHNHRSA